MSNNGMKFPNGFGGPIGRFAKNYIPEPNTGCWIWLGHLSGSRGYGYLNVNRKSIKAHRFSYEFHKGKIPDGFVVDHLCNNPWCVNPDHLEAVTQTINIQRAVAGKFKIFCHRGHERSGDNLYIFPSGAKACRECVRISVRKYQEKKRREKRHAEVIE